MFRPIIGRSSLGCISVGDRNNSNYSNSGTNISSRSAGCISIKSSSSSSSSSNMELTKIVKYALTMMHLSQGISALLRRAWIQLLRWEKW